MHADANTPHCVHSNTLGLQIGLPAAVKGGVGMLINNQHGNMVNDKREEPGSDQLATLRLHRSLSLSAEKP